MKSPSDWALAKHKHKSNSVSYANIPGSDMTEEDLPEGVNLSEVRRLVSLEEFVEFPDS